MDKIRLEIGKREDPANGMVDAVEIFINNRNLVDIVREVELPFAQQESKPDLAGSYVGLPPEDIFSPSRRLLGEPSTYYDHDHSEDKLAVLGCVCGEPGCWPLLVRITVEENVVIWDGFEQPFRSKGPYSISEGRAIPWEYDLLRPFVFDKAQYLSELSKSPGNGPPG